VSFAEGAKAVSGARARLQAKFCRPYDPRGHLFGCQRGHRLEVQAPAAATCTKGSATGRLG